MLLMAEYETIRVMMNLGFKLDLGGKKQLDNGEFVGLMDLVGLNEIEARQQIYIL